MSRKPVIAVVGAGHEIEPAISQARELGRMIAEKGWVLISGGRNAGVMKAANEGAKMAKDSLTIGILPNRDSSPALSVDIAIVTDTGNGRNNIIVLSADVVIACGVDGAGTASEVALAIKNGKQPILLGVNEESRAFFEKIAPDAVHVADSPEEAIAKATSLLGLK